MVTVDGITCSISLTEAFTLSSLGYKSLPNLMPCLYESNPGYKEQKSVIFLPQRHFFAALYCDSLFSSETTTMIDGSKPLLSM